MREHETVKNKKKEKKKKEKLNTQPPCEDINRHQTSVVHTQKVFLRDAKC